MIDYVEIRNESLELLGLIDTAKSIIWETQYFGAGSFEVYTEATPAAIDTLRCGNFVTRVDNDGVGIIEAVEIVFNARDGRMIAASGRLAKSILDRRLISYVNGNSNAPTFFSGNVEQRARGLVQDNAIACYKDKARTIPYTARNISLLQLGSLAGLTATTTRRQVNCDNLLTYTDEMLRQYGYGAKVIQSGSKLAYTVYSGKDRSFGNAAGNEPVIFSEDFDNLTGSNYSYDEANSKTYVLVGGEGEGVDRFYMEGNPQQSGLARREVFVDARNAAREVYEDKYKGNGTARTYALVTHAATSIKSAVVDGYETACKFDAAAQTVTFAAAPANGVDITVQYIDDNEYRTQLLEDGQQELAALVAAENFSGEVDLANSSFVYGTDFEIGDIVTVQDNSINKYVNVRIVTVAEVQDDNGHQVKIEFEAV